MIAHRFCLITTKLEITPHEQAIQLQNSFLAYQVPTSTSGHAVLHAGRSAGVAINTRADEKHVEHVVCLSKRQHAAHVVRLNFLHTT